MSRTDRTKPLWVRQREHGPVPEHDHTEGPCDLPSEPTRERSGTRCRWEPPCAVVMRRGCCSGCNKRGCTAEWRAHTRAANRRRRHEDRRRARAWRGSGDR